MSKQVEIKIRIPLDARSNDYYPFIEDDRFIKYCKANKVDVDKNLLEGYEKCNLFYPCARIMYPRELLIRRFRAGYPSYQKKYKVKDEWKELINLDNLLSGVLYCSRNKLHEALEYGHPIEGALKEGSSFVLNPEQIRFRAWNRYKVTIGDSSGNKYKRSRAKHYYSSWKIFFVEDLNTLNTIKSNMASGIRCACYGKKPRQTTLSEYTLFFEIISSFAYREYLLRYDYLMDNKLRHNDWEKVKKRMRRIAKRLFSEFKYKEWIRFLAKLIEMREKYINSEKNLLSFEMDAYISRMVFFLLYATEFEFNKICYDYSRGYKRTCGSLYNDGVIIYPEKLEEIFPNERWDLEQNVSRFLKYDFERFNDSLAKSEQLPELFNEELFEKLLKSSESTALLAIRKIYKYLNEVALHRDSEIWSGVTDLAISIEVQSKKWIEKNSLDGVFKKVFPKEYQKLIREVGGNVSDANNSTEFIDKLKKIQDNNSIPVDIRCGRHLLISKLVRNYATHKEGLSGAKLHNNLSVIYTSLVDTLFVIYAEYKKSKLFDR